MKLNHLNLTVTSALETQKFLEKYFGLKPMGRATAKMAFVSDDSGMVISMFAGKERLLYVFREGDAILRRRLL
jgi:hypothetical protein